MIRSRHLPPPCLAWLILPAALVGCSDPPAAPAPVDVVALPRTGQWSGGLVGLELQGTDVREEDVVVLGRDTLERQPAWPGRIHVRLPPDVDGPLALTVLRDGSRLGTAEIEAYGLVGLRVFPERMAAFQTTVPGGPGVAVVGPGYGPVPDDRGGVVWLHLSSGTHRWLPGLTEPRSCYRVGVDPSTADLFIGTGVGCSELRVGRIVAGEFVMERTVSLPCSRWGCEPLAGDIWMQFDPGVTCRIVTGEDGETACERIAYEFNHDPQGIVRLWSADRVTFEHGRSPVFEISTGEVAYGVEVPGPLTVAADETRRLFWLVRHGAMDALPTFHVLGLRGADGDVHVEFHVPKSATVAGWPVPEIAFEPARDLLFLLRTDTRTLEVRDPDTFDRVGEMKLPGLPASWDDGRILFDQGAGMGYVVLTAAFGDHGTPVPGTPVITFRLPP